MRQYKIYIVIILGFAFVLLLLILTKKESPYGLAYNGVRETYGIELLDSSFRSDLFDSNPKLWKTQDKNSIHVLKKIGVWDTIVNEGDLFIIRYGEEEYHIKKFFFYEDGDGKASLIKIENEKNIFLFDTCYHCFDSILQLNSHKECMLEIKKFIPSHVKP